MNILVCLVNNNPTAADQHSENNKNRQNDSGSNLNQHVQSDILEDLSVIDSEFLLKFNMKLVGIVASKVWDEVGDVNAVPASLTTGKCLQRVIIPLGFAWWSLNIWHFVKDYRENKIALRELIRRIGRYVVTEMDTAGLACLILTLVAGTAGFAVGIGLVVLLSPLDYFLGDRISKLLLHRPPEEKEAWHVEQLRKRKQGILRKAYKILQIEEHASNWEVDRAYRDAARIYHPCKRAQDIQVYRFDVINKAYTLVKQDRSQNNEKYEVNNNTITPSQAITER
ncbi:Hypothetical predicted protein [Mytilus galloprovincialis]|uniref:J domain-containing protein n=1 Tax=Mytilus galloprovincialis TaxID=29158 RepID=A0A8B6FU56_MYTGA|nr:Hypothetical predicted protein [Mytilus galloprovincialis]